MKLTFWGTGTSTGVPMVGCDCPICRSSDPRNRRRRASVLLESGARRWLIDAGPDFRTQALEAGLMDLDGVFLTHAHADHILGLDDLRPLSWKRTVPVWADANTTDHVRQAFPYFFGEGDGKTSRPRLDFRELWAGIPVEVPGLTILPVAVRHGDASILGFRVGTLAYLTDCNGIPDSSLPLLEGLDTLILGALRPRPHPTHFSLDEAVAMASRVGARRTFFTHFSHEVDHAVWAETLPPGLSPAFDGLAIDFEA
jgi:phosphoribosyl 1,2-cyclic phosphate phosphodiesterase